MNDEGFGGVTDPAVLKKARAVRLALYGFISCLIGAVCSLSLNVPLAMAGEIAGGAYRDILGKMAVAADHVSTILFVGTIASFGFLIFSLVRPPREVDVRPLLKPSLGGLVLIFAAGADFFVLVTVGCMGIFMVGLYIEGRNPVFASLAALCASFVLFTVSVTSSIAAGFRRGTGGPPWMGRFSRKPGESPAPEPRKNGGLMSIAEILLSAALSVSVYLLFEFDAVRETLAGLAGRVTGRTPSASELFFRVLALFIFFFAMSFALKGVKTLWTLFRPTPEAGKRL